MAVDHQDASQSPPPPSEEPIGRSEGPVVLNIGRDIGAVVILAPADLDGTEIEVRRQGAEWEGTHVAIRARPTVGEPIYAAVFGQLREGAHEFRLRPVDPGGSVNQIDVVGGELVEHPWET